MDTNQSSTSESLPRVNLPDSTGRYRVVQLMVDGEPYLRFGKANADHAEILSEFLSEAGIGHETTERGRKTIPVAQGERYEAVGMGDASVYALYRAISLSGKSPDYEIEINPKHLEAMRSLLDDWFVRCQSGN